MRYSVRSSACQSQPTDLTPLMFLLLRLWMPHPGTIISWG